MVPISPPTIPSGSRLICIWLINHGDLGIDICLGLPIDKKASPYEYMYLPDYIESSFDHATIVRNGEEVPLVKQKIPVFVNVPREVVKAPIHPWAAFGGFFAIALGLSIYDARRKKASRYFDLLLFAVLGALGILLLLLWTGTDHAAAANNLNLFWALPTNLIVLGMFSPRPFRMLRNTSSGYRS